MITALLIWLSFSAAFLLLWCLPCYIVDAVRALRDRRRHSLVRDSRLEPLIHDSRATDGAGGCTDPRPTVHGRTSPVPGLSDCGMGFQPVLLLGPGGDYVREWPREIRHSTLDIRHSEDPDDRFVHNCFAL